MKKTWSKTKERASKTWKFLWHDDSIWSWIANIIVAFLLIRFIVYPLLGAVLGTSFPIVAVVSESMEHSPERDILCGQKIDNFKESFDNYWDVCGKWYEEREITQQQFASFPLKNGFNKGDVIILWRANRHNIDVGDVLVFQGNKPQPIIHRVVKTWQEDDTFYYQTKGDHNSDTIKGTFGEEKINENRVFGKGVLRIPYLGWLKILFVDAVEPLGIIIEQ